MHLVIQIHVLVRVEIFLASISRLNLRWPPFQLFFISHCLGDLLQSQALEAGQVPFVQDLQSSRG